MHRQFMAIYDSLFDDIYRYVFVKTSTKWDTDDLVSEIFKKALEDYSPRIRNPRAWLFRIAKNTVTDFYRNKRELVLGSNPDEMRESESGFEIALEAREQVQRLKECLSTLSPEDFELINLHYFASMKYKDMGEMLGRSEGSIKMKIMRAKNQLGVLMKKAMEG